MMVRVVRHRGGAPPNLISAPDTSVKGAVANTFVVAHLPGHIVHTTLQWVLGNYL